LLDLREALRAASAVNGSPVHHQSLAPTAEGMQIGHPDESPHTHNIDPAIAGQSYALSAGDSGGDEVEVEGTGKKGSKRELSQSKRAAQNRAAQVSTAFFSTSETSLALFIMNRG